MTSEIICTILICHTAIEWTDPSKAALCTLIIMVFYSLGLMVLSGVAYLIHDWRILQLVLFSPLVLVLGMFYWFLPESPRWLMTQGRKEEAQKELWRAAKVNGRTISEDQLDKVSCIKHTWTKKCTSL